jgi:hypothetical protein
MNANEIKDTIKEGLKVKSILKKEITALKEEERNNLILNELKGLKVRCILKEDIAEIAEIIEENDIIELPFFYNAIESVKGLKQMVIEGAYSDFGALLQIKELQEQIDEAREACIKSAIDNFERNSSDNGKTVERNGCVFRITQSCTYDYTTSPDWVRLKQNMKVLEKKMQFASRTLADYEDIETGEIIPRAIKNLSKRSIKIESK